MDGYVHLTRYYKVDIDTNQLGWLYREANHRPGHQEDFIFSIRTFWFIQYYQWFLHPYKDTYRLLIGHLANYKERCEVWVHWEVVARTSTRPAFYGLATSSLRTSNR